MGAWGEGPFENDAAGDWAYDFEGLDLLEGFGLLDSTLQAAAPPTRGRRWKRARGHDGGFLDADEGSAAVAAAEIVAHLVDRAPPASTYGEDAYAWVERTAATADRPLVELALAALGRVAGEGSELADLWDEADGSGWRSSIARIEERLRAVS